MIFDTKPTVGKQELVTLADEGIWRIIFLIFMNSPDVQNKLFFSYVKNGDAALPRACL